MMFRLDPPLSRLELGLALLGIIAGLLAGYAFGQVVFP